MLRITGMPLLKVSGRLMGLKSNQPLPDNRIAAIRFGTTAATNALLERKGGRVALLITKGFADLLEIGYQNRPDIFQLCIRKPHPLYSRVIEADERIDCQGGVIKDFDVDNFSRALRGIDPALIDSVAVVLMHSWKILHTNCSAKKYYYNRAFLILCCPTGP